MCQYKIIAKNILGEFGRFNWIKSPFMEHFFQRMAHCGWGYLIDQLIYANFWVALNAPFKEPLGKV